LQHGVELLLCVLVLVLGYFGHVAGPDTASVAPNSWPKEADVTSHPTLASSSDTSSTWQLRNVAQPYAQTLTAQTRERIRKDVLSKRLPELPTLGTGIALKKTIKMKHGAIRFDDLVRTQGDDRRRHNITPAAIPTHSI
jgi:hypothetical protein